MIHALVPIRDAVWVALAALLGLAVGFGLHRVIQILPERMAAAWRREACELLELDDDESPAVTSHGHTPRVWPIVLASGFASAAVVATCGPGEAAVSGLVLTWCLIALAGIDYQTQLLPDQLTLPLLWLGLLLTVRPVFVAAPVAIEGAVFGYGALWCISMGCKLITGTEGMGAGDMKLLAALGAWMGPSALIPIVLLSSLLGTATTGFLILVRRHDRHQPFPFGPSLAIAGWVWFLAGKHLWPMAYSLAAP